MSTPADAAARIPLHYCLTRNRRYDVMKQQLMSLLSSACICHVCVIRCNVCRRVGDGDGNGGSEWLNEWPNAARLLLLLSAALRLALTP